MASKPDNHIVEWFEDAEFMVQLIKRGISAMFTASLIPAEKAALYLYDRRYEQDGENIAKAAKEWNEKHDKTN